jgi:hypothetical protein
MFERQGPIGQAAVSSCTRPRPSGEALMTTITDEMLKRAAKVFCDGGFEISLPSEGDLDDVERERYETLKAALTAALADRVVVRRSWLADVRDQMMKMKLESGPAGDFIFLLREMLTDILDRPAAPPPASAGGG